MGGWQFRSKQDYTRLSTGHREQYKCCSLCTVLYSVHRIQITVKKEPSQTRGIHIFTCIHLSYICIIFINSLIFLHQCSAQHYRVQTGDGSSGPNKVSQTQDSYTFIFLYIYYICIIFTFNLHHIYIFFIFLQL